MSFFVALPDLRKFGVSQEDLIRLSGHLSPYWKHGNKDYPVPTMSVKMAALYLDEAILVISKGK